MRDLGAPYHVSGRAFQEHMSEPASHQWPPSRQDLAASPTTRVALSLPVNGSRRRADHALATPVPAGVPRWNPDDGDFR
jgi:hypothetical protein